MLGQLQEENKTNNINPNQLSSEISVLKKIGYKIEAKTNSIKIYPGAKLQPINIKTGPFPNFATDNMPMILAVLTTISEKVKSRKQSFQIDLWQLQN